MVARATQWRHIKLNRGQLQLGTRQHGHRFLTTSVGLRLHYCIDAWFDMYELAAYGPSARFIFSCLLQLIRQLKLRTQDA